MKIKNIFVIAMMLLGITLISCKNEEFIPTMTLSANSFNIAPSEATLSIEVRSQSNWNVSSDADWCAVSKQQGYGQTTIEITLTTNETTQERTANITISDPTATLNVAVRQVGEEHYILPIIFHVLYADANDPRQNPSEATLKEITQICNQRFAGNYDDGDKGRRSADINIEFVLATTDPNGKILAEPGVNRIKWDTPTINPSEFMSINNKKAIPLIWNLNKYINVFLYTFEGINLSGISFMPYASSTHPLAGLDDGDVYFTDTMMEYPHCLSINNFYLYEIPIYNIINGDDVTTTLTHELGHYLGLDHAFGVETNYEGNHLNWQDNTDYCEDTPNYDRDSYEKWLYEYYRNTPMEEIEIQLKRVSITGSEFISRNIMDYYDSYNNEFTPNQRDRIRHVLKYSPLVPGSMFDKPDTRAITDYTIPRIRTIE